VNTTGLDLSIPRSTGRSSRELCRAFAIERVSRTGSGLGERRGLPSRRQRGSGQDHEARGQGAASVPRTGRAIASSSP